MKRKVVASIMAMFLLFSATKAFCVGSSAFRVELVDTEAMSKGFAFVGEANNPSAVFYNPAGLTQLKSGQHLSLGLIGLTPATDFTNEAGTKYQMNRETFPLPHFYYTNNFGLERMVFGIGMVAPWGLSTEWNEDSGVRYCSTRTRIASDVTMLTAAYKLTEKISLGVAFDYVRGNMGRQKRILQAGAGDGNFEMNIKDNFAWGYRLALLYTINDRHSLGLQYRSPVELKLRGYVTMENLSSVIGPYGNMGFAFSYAGIMGGSSYNEKMYMEAELPQAVIIGYNFKPSDKWAINLDVEWTNWASIEQEYLIYQYETNATRLSILNDGNPASRDWNNAIAMGLGGQYNLNEKLRLRSGCYYKEKAVPEANFEPALPDNNTFGFTAGFGYSFNEKITLDVGYAFQKFLKRKIDNNTFSGTIDGKYNTYANMYGATLRFDF